MSEVKVNKISPRSGTDVTLGDSGDTFTIPSGATINNQGTAVNFGATGSASWVTTVKTSTFTAVAGEGYFVNTTGGVVSVNLPVGVAGAVVAVKDYANTFDTNAVTLVQNGSDKIGGSTVNATLDTEGIAVTLVFIDSTQGWLVTDSGLQDEAPTAQFITATGGTAATSSCGNYKIHTFTGPGTFTVCSVGNAAGSNTVDYLIVAGGGGSAGGPPGSIGTGGGGAGGTRFFVSPDISGHPAAPLNGPAAIPVSAQGYPISVTAGGAGSPNGSASVSGTQGGSASALGLTSAGGGGGGADSGAVTPGGSGGGGANNNPAGNGNDPSTTPAQGTPGGSGSPTSGPGWGSGGGGGAKCAGQPAQGIAGGDGGTGVGFPTVFLGSSGQPSGGFQYFGGGGGAGTRDGSGTPTLGAAGLGGGAIGQNSSLNPSGPGVGQAQSGTANTGGGAGGGAGSPGSFNGGTGGSGIVIIRYKFQ